MTTDPELLAAFDRQEQLVAQFQGVRRSNRILIVVVAVLSVLVVGFAMVAVQAHHIADDVKANSAADRRESDAQALTACRLRNGANAVVRDQFGRYNDALAALVTSPNGQAAIAALRASVPTAQETDRDCNADGGLDAADYPTS